MHVYRCNHFKSTSYIYKYIYSFIFVSDLLYTHLYNYVSLFIYSLILFINIIHSIYI